MEQLVEGCCAIHEDARRRGKEAVVEARLPVDLGQGEGEGEGEGGGEGEGEGGGEGEGERERERETPSLRRGCPSTCM